MIYHMYVTANWQDLHAMCKSRMCLPFRFILSPFFVTNNHFVDENVFCERWTKGCLPKLLPPKCLHCSLYYKCYFVFTFFAILALSTLFDKLWFWHIPYQYKFIVLSVDALKHSCNICYVEINIIHPFSCHRDVID